MSRYFFHVYDGCFHHDEEGLELLDCAAAMSEAMRTVAEMVRDGKPNCAMIVTDADHTIRFKLNFACEVQEAVSTGIARVP